MIPPIDQPRKPRKFEELLDECIMAGLTHDNYRKFIAKRFEEDRKAR